LVSFELRLAAAGEGYRTHIEVLTVAPVAVDGARLNEALDPWHPRVSYSLYERARLRLYHRRPTKCAHPALHAPS
jgi:hypothetical protein